MTIILRVYRQGKLVARADETGVIHVVKEGLGDPYVELPYVSESCIPQYADANQKPRAWGHAPEVEE